MNEPAQLSFLPDAPRPRVKRMHVVDVGDNPHGPGAIACFVCKHCDHKSEWLVCLNRDVWRGLPCPKCNPSPENA